MKLKQLILKKFSGQTFVELVLAMGLAALILPALVAAFMTTREGRPQQQQRLQAIALLKETEQAVKSIRSGGWTTFTNVTNGSSYHPVITNSKWTFSSGTGTVNDFTQSVVLSDVSRNSNGDIVTSGGTVDPSTKKVEITISWTTPQASSVTSTSYFTRTENSVFEHTSEEDFDDGTLDDTQILTASGGEVALGNNNKGKWCEPAFSAATVDLPDGPPVAVDVKSSTSSINVPNDVFVATAPTTGTSVKFAYVTTTANTDPPTPTSQGMFTLDPTKYSNASYVPTGIGLDNTFKTNDVKYYQSASGKKYALIATDLPDKEVIAVLVDDNNSSNNETTTGEFADPVNNIYKYWTYFNTRLYAGSSQPTIDTGFFSPTANAAVTGGDNNGFQTNASSAYADDSAEAQDDNSGTATGTTCGSTGKDRHQYYNYNISIPSGVSISGIEVRLDAWVNSTSGSPDPMMCVELSWDGGTTWTNALSNTLGTSQTAETFGGSSNTWGRTWSAGDFSNANFRVRITNVANDNTRDFTLDWAAVKIYYPSGNYDEAPYDYGATSIAVLGTTGYLASGGYLYVFDLSNIDSKNSGSSLDMLGCRIELDGYDCNSSTDKRRKYGSGATGTSWGTEQNATAGCSDGGNVELYATNDIYPVQTGGSTYIFVAVGNGVDPELDVVNATSIPSGSTSPTISNTACGRATGGNAAWKLADNYDFNSISGTQEAANSVFARADGNRAYISSNGGIDGNNDGQPDSKQFYIINTETKTNIGPIVGSYAGATPAPTADTELYPRRALTVQNGSRAVLVGQDGVSNGNDAEEYQVLDNSTESSPQYCGGLDFDTGFNDLTSASELDGDNYLYMVANGTDNALKIIQGGPDNAIYVADGIYYSDPYDALSSAAFNRFEVDIVQPTNTTIKLQVAVEPLNAASCDEVNYTYLGPNGTSDLNDQFTTSTIGESTLSGVFPLLNYPSTPPNYQNPGRCFRYKATMNTTDQLNTPQLKEIRWNYSP